MASLIQNVPIPAEALAASLPSSYTERWIFCRSYEGIKWWVCLVCLGTCDTCIFSSGSSNIAKFASLLNMVLIPNSFSGVLSLRVFLELNFGRYTRTLLFLLFFWHKRSTLTWRWSRRVKLSSPSQSLLFIAIYSVGDKVIDASFQDKAQSTSLFSLKVYEKRKKKKRK